MITLENDRLTFSFPEVHAEAVCGIELQRTLRIPDDSGWRGAGPRHRSRLDTSPAHCARAKGD
jgi:hypothetical protein